MKMNSNVDHGRKKKEFPDQSIFACLACCRICTDNLRNNKAKGSCIST